ncbi:MAG: 5'-nucleotidase C-terminal domain-containing protein [Eubacteriales bacterium]|nr:5'-nucleotidase C-terminal domain-containing protein [Eubacteriales bacterium]
MGRKLTVFYTSDCHGSFEALSRCSASFAHGGNALIIDGGDTLHGSPLAYYLCRRRNGSGKENLPFVPAQIMNSAGYHSITLGNHDFSFGQEILNEYLSGLNAECLCANLSGLANVKGTAVVTLENGLRVGVAGITSSTVPSMESSDNLAGLTFSDAFSAAAEALAELKKQNTDITVCLYHGGFEFPPDEYLSSPEHGCALPEEPCLENQGLRIAEKLDYDILLTAHQHNLLSGETICGTFVCQLLNQCGGYIRLEAEEGTAGEISVSGGFFSAENNAPDEEVERILLPVKKHFRTWLESEAGNLDSDLIFSGYLDAAVNGSLLANFFNQVQLSVSGADISCTALGNEQKGIPSKVTNGDVIRGYSYANTLAVIETDRAMLKKALERCAEYFERDSGGELHISEAFLKPMVQHFNYDYFSGIEYVIDTRRPLGDRVVSIKYKGRELGDAEKLTLCMNNYRASGNGGYPFYREAKTVSVVKKEVQELIFETIGRSGTVSVDRHKWAAMI